MPKPAVPPEERVWQFVDASGDCWEWIGYRGPLGYGQFKVAKEICRIAHRYIYELMVGPVPEGLELDHLCRNRGCVNPDHLQVVSHSVNMLRSAHPWVLATRSGHCSRGHALTGENLGHQRQRTGRFCKTCHRDARRRRTARKSVTA